MAIHAELDNIFVVRPGDKLVIARADRLTMKASHDIMEHVTKRLPGVEVIIVDECSGLAVYRDEHPWKTRDDGAHHYAAPADSAAQFPANS